MEWNGLLQYRFLRHANAYANGNGYAYTDSYANGDSNSYAYTDSYSNGNNPAETKPDTKAAPNAAAASVASTEIVKARTPERNSRVHRLAHANRARS
jgi:hypothetical protein